MKVQVFWNAGSTGPAKVDANIESIRVEDILKHRLREDDQVHHLKAFIRIEVFQLGYLLEGEDHQMPGIVWIPVQEDIVMSGTMDNERLAVVSQFGQPREWAFNSIDRIRVRGDVVHAPVCV